VSLRIRLHRSPLHSALSFAVNLNEFWAKFWYRLQVKSHITVPHAGPVIITANHTCAADPLFLCAAVTYRPLAFMVAREFANIPVARFFLRLVECIPVRRDGNDTAATKQALRHLRAGKALGIFIEGRIIRPGEVGEPRDGVALLALKTGARVIPAHICGTKYYDSIVREMLTRHRAEVRFGPPVDLSEFSEAGGGRDAVRGATERIYAAIKALAPGGDEA
jgi:1-acyl-sn-glycerol-3-phosphate acyltransferase